MQSGYEGDYVQTDVTLLQREQRMTANAARAVKATRELV
ncbi:transcriptional regulator, partial [Escherichia coli]|nr:transcriptional regulator [Escherichia coli]